MKHLDFCRVLRVAAERSYCYRANCKIFPANMCTERICFAQGASHGKIYVGLVQESEVFGLGGKVGEIGRPSCRERV